MSKQGTWSSNWWAAWRSKEEELTYCQGAFVGWQEEIPQVWRWKWWHTENLPYICPYITSPSSSSSSPPSLPVPVAVAVNFSHHRYHHLNMPVFFLKNMHPAFFFTKNHHLPKKSSSAMRFVSHPGLYPSHVMALSRWPIFSALAYFRDTHRGRGRSKKTSTGKQSIRINMNHLLKIYEDINCHQIILFETFWICKLLKTHFLQYISSFWRICWFIVLQLLYLLVKTYSIAFHSNF